MKSKVTYIFLAVMLLGLTVSTSSTLKTTNVTADTRVFTPGDTFLLDIGHDQTHSYDYNALTAYLVETGFDVVVLGTGDAGSGVYTDDILSSVDAVLLPGPYSASGAYTADELAAFTAWWALGNKSIWVGGDSDYASNNEPVVQANAVLDAIGSSIYLEQGYVDDPICNIAGGSYRPLAIDFEEHAITEGVGTYGVLMHGPTSVMGLNGSTYVPLELENSTLWPNDVWPLVYANDSAYYNRNTGPTAENYVVHDIDRTGNITLMACEEVTENDNRIVVSGEAFFTEWKGMFPEWNGSHYIEEKGNPVDNFIMINNTLHWLATPGNYPGGLFYEFSPATVTATITNEVNVTVTADPVTEQVTVVTTETETPGFEVMLALIPLVAIGYWFIRRRR